MNTEYGIALQKIIELETQVAALTQERDRYEKERNAYRTHATDVSNELVLANMKAADEAKACDRAWNKLEAAQARIAVLREALAGQGGYQARQKALAIKEQS